MGVVNLKQSGSVTINLVDGFTDEFEFRFGDTIIIEVYDISGIDGSPTYEFQTSGSGEVFKSYNPPFTNSISINDSLTIERVIANKLRIRIIANDNTTGNCKIKLING